jgi:hypothetical protein
MLSSEKFASRGVSRARLRYNFFTTGAEAALLVMKLEFISIQLP